MKISIEKLGVFEKTELDIGDLTILCGENNTGKTYVTYALYGFLRFWSELFRYPLEDKWLATLIKTGECTILKNELIESFNTAWLKACEEYVNRGVLADCFGGDDGRFKHTVFKVEPPVFEFQPCTLEAVLKDSREIAALGLESTLNSDGNILIRLSSLATEMEDKTQVVTSGFSRLLKTCTYRIQPFIISAERTGVALFRGELDFARTKALDILNDKAKQSPEEFLYKFITQFHSDYPRPVQDSVEFARSLESLSKKKSQLAHEHPDLLKEFLTILGGTYKVTKIDGVRFLPKNKLPHLLKNALDMNDSSGAVRSLLQLSFYLHHVAKKNDFLIIDEPELNLHPASQRLMARLLAKLVNVGINIFVTTHSDYFVRELNTLLMLKGEEIYLKTIAKKNGYKENELLTLEQIRLYTAKKTTKGYTLEKAKITSQYGIEAKTFDSTIDEMNKIQESIIFGGDE